MIRALLAATFALFLSFLFTGCASDAHISANSDILKENNSSETIVEYHIGVDDTVNINVWRNPELSVTVPVRPDGKISMPLIGDVHAAGSTPEAVAELIQEKLKKLCPRSQCYIDGNRLTKQRIPYSTAYYRCSRKPNFT